MRIFLHRRRQHRHPQPIRRFLGQRHRQCIPMLGSSLCYDFSPLLVPLKTDTATFLKRRLIRVVIPFIIWSLLYATLPYLWGGLSSNEVASSLTRLLYNFNGASGHMWFVYMLIGIYLFMPVISPWLEKSDKRSLQGYLFLWILSSFFPYLHSFLLVAACEAHAGLFIEVDADGVEVVTVHDGDGQSFLQAGKLGVGELHLVGGIFEVAADDGCGNIDDLVGALVYLVESLYLPSFGCSDGGDDGTVFKECLALLLRETVKPSGFELRVEHHVHAAVIHADERETGTGMDFLSAFVGDMDGKNRGTATVEDVLYRLLWQVFKHLLCQTESFEYAVWQFLALKSLNLHFYNFYGLSFPQNYMRRSDSRVFVSMILRWFMLI